MDNQSWSHLLYVAVSNTRGQQVTANLCGWSAEEKLIQGCTRFINLNFFLLTQASWTWLWTKLNNAQNRNCWTYPRYGRSLSFNKLKLCFSTTIMLQEMCLSKKKKHYGDKIRTKGPPFDNSCQKDSRNMLNNIPNWKSTFSYVCWIKKLNCELIHPKMENLERALSYC